MPKHHLDITVVHRGLKREGALGFCTVMDCDHRPREFLIEMETTLSEDLYCQTLLHELWHVCLLYTSPSPRDGLLSRMPSSA